MLSRGHDWLLLARDVPLVPRHLSLDGRAVSGWPELSVGKSSFEIGFTALFSPRLVAWELFALEPSRYGWVAVSGLRWLLFRLMIGFGKTKFIDGEATRDNSLYIRTFLFVQPLPNKLARFVAELPASWSLLWKGSLFFMWLVEVPLPFLMLLPWTREIAAYGTMMLQVGIFATGCFGHFNVLTALLCLTLFPPGLADDPGEAPPLTYVEWLFLALYGYSTLICVVALNSGSTFMWSQWSGLTKATHMEPSFDFNDGEPCTMRKRVETCSRLWCLPKEHFAARSNASLDRRIMGWRKDMGALQVEISWQGALDCRPLSA